MLAEDKEHTNRTWEALKVIGQSLPELFRNYNHLLSLTDWSPEQEQTFQGFVYNLVFIVRMLQHSTMRTTSHPWKMCLEVLEAFEDAIKNSKPVPTEHAIRLNSIFQEALMEWDAEMN